MARKQFSIVYPDGSKKHIGCAERDALLSSSEIKKIDHLRYAFTGEVRRYHSFADLAPLRTAVAAIGPIRKYLEGSFIFELRGRRTQEFMESEAGLAIRLQA